MSDEKKKKERKRKVNTEWISKVKPGIFDIKNSGYSNYNQSKSSFYVYNSSPYREKEGGDVTKAVWK